MCSFYIIFYLKINEFWNSPLFLLVPVPTPGGPLCVSIINHQIYWYCWWFQLENIAENSSQDTEEYQNLKPMHFKTIVLSDWL